MAVVGHAQALATLPEDVPSTVLIVGPEGVGKRLIARDLALRTGVHPADYRNFGSMTLQDARELATFHRNYPLAGDVRVSVADLTHASHAVQNSLLKLLEEPPTYSRIILHTDREPLLTVKSRCTQVRCGLLSEDEVATVLTVLGSDLPQEAAQASQGRVSVALEYVTHHPAKNLLSGIFSALEKRDGKALEDALHHALGIPDRTSGEEHAERMDVLKRMLRRAIMLRTGPLASVRVPQWKEALDIMDRPGRPVLLIRSAVWTLASGL